MSAPITIELIYEPSESKTQQQLINLWAAAVAACLRAGLQSGRYAVGDDGLVICATMETKTSEEEL